MLEHRFCLPGAFLVEERCYRRLGRCGHRARIPVLRQERTRLFSLALGARRVVSNQGEHLGRLFGLPSAQVKTSVGEQHGQTLADRAQVVGQPERLLQQWFGYGHLCPQGIKQRQVVDGRRKGDAMGLIAEERQGGNQQPLGCFILSKTDESACRSACNFSPAYWRTRCG